jgi:hypothetical protein
LRLAILLAGVVALILVVADAPTIAFYVVGIVATIGFVAATTGSTDNDAVPPPHMNGGPRVRAPRSRAARR